jgi:hypothetical protein
MVPSITKYDLGAFSSIAKNTRHGGIGRLRIILIVSVEFEAKGTAVSRDRVGALCWVPVLLVEVADVASEPTDSERVPRIPAGAELIDIFRDPGRC